MRYGLILAASLALVGAANGATVIYINEATFVAQLSSYYNETFDDYVYSIPLNGEQLTQSYGPLNGFSFTASTATKGLFSGDGALSTKEPTNTLLITFTAGTVTAAGGIFEATDINASLANQLVTVDSDGLDAPESVLKTGFIGFISDTPITWFSVTADQTNAPTYPQINSLYAATAVPEPSMLGAIGALSTLLIRIRAKKA